ncbi:hypothetical protein SAMN04488515_3350 [Cognatiyoonia koreensis]|uniref:Uncharacterized protein n=1 Tax=Cognatiyoonia koreensis TaxID=364200 RepID=A0A1I0RXH9_9RHOB|nr:hypothetical protein [Cognatiyoonia koreensis]SEW45544.1 hypothetical protein SAMN04488515_3350 [Cognatiyoonia koreensis]
MTRIAIILVLTVLWAGQAAALSCLRPDPVRSFQQFKDAPEAYHILYGTLSFDENLMPQGVVNEERNPPPVTAQFVGKGLTSEGFSVDLDRAITLQPICAGPWCGSIASDVPYLMFAQVEGPAITLAIPACGGTAFADPTVADLDQMTRCLTGGSCSPEP